MSTDRVVTTSTDSLATCERSSAGERTNRQRSTTPSAFAASRQRFRRSCETSLKTTEPAPRSNAPNPISPSPQPTSSSVSPSASAALSSTWSRNCPTCPTNFFRSSASPPYRLVASHSAQQSVSVTRRRLRLPGCDQLLQLLARVPRRRAMAADGQVEVEAGKLLDRTPCLLVVEAEHRDGRAEGFAGDHRVAGDQRRSEAVGRVARRVTGGGDRLQPLDDVARLDPVVDRRRLREEI